MAEILITGLEMPSSCYGCFISLVDHDYDLFCCPILHKEFRIEDTKRLNECPLIELPPHGDLIERKETVQKLMDVICEGCKHTDDCGWCAMAEYRHIVENAPTVIPASEGE